MFLLAPLIELFALGSSIARQAIKIESNTFPRGNYLLHGASRAKIASTSIRFELLANGMLILTSSFAEVGGIGVGSARGYGSCRLNHHQLELMPVDALMRRR